MVVQKQNLLLIQRMSYSTKDIQPLRARILTKTNTQTYIEFSLNNCFMVPDNRNLGATARQESNIDVYEVPASVQLV